LVPGWFLSREGLAVIGRSRDPHLPAGLALSCIRSFSMPGNINVTVMVSRYRSAAVQPKRMLHEILLWFECFSAIIHSGVQHRRPWFTGFRIERPFRSRYVRSVPRDVNAIILAQCDLAASNRPQGDSASRLTIHPDWF
jgi:hypothetical protein